MTHSVPSCSPLPLPPLLSSVLCLLQVTASSEVDVAWVYVVTFGGGLVAGDVIPMQLTVGENATLAVASQASTKVGSTVARALLL